MNKLRDAASFLKTKFQTDQLDQKLTEAVSQQNWQASTQLLHQIANASYNFEKEQKIIAFIYEKIKNKSWKKILKTLHLVDFLLKYGPTTLIDNLKENIYEFRQLDDYKNHSQGIDRGQSIRKQSKAVVTLLSDDHLLNEERAKAKQIKDRMATVIGSGAYYGNFSSDVKTSGPNYDNKNVGGYTSFSSDSYKYTGSASGSNGLSFGQSVMKELQDKKKKVEPVQEKKPNPPKLNLSNMNERKAQKKAQEQKANFSNLSLKLVKPPEKKATLQTKPQVNSIAQKHIIQSSEKPQQKVANSFDIMDLDFNAMGVNQTTQTNQAQTFDFLGASQTQKTQNFNNLQPKKLQSSLPFTSQHQVAQNNFLLGQINPPSNNQIPPKPQTQIYQNTVKTPIYPQQYQYNNNFGNLSGFSVGNYQNNTHIATNIYQTALSKPQGSNNLGLNLNTVKLALIQQKQQNKPSDSLIDLSNFREELNNISAKDKKESITTNWNW